MFWCPGCRQGHVVRINSTEHPSWSFDGNVEAPTITPSYREYIPANADRGRPEKTTCHCIVTRGEIAFCGDSPHTLSGKTVPMEPIPADYGGLEN
jgi:hypothetical protein